MAGLLKNSTIGASSTSSSTSNYGFPSSGSFTHQKQPIMPKDQKAKLLAMHRDGKANAGIYVAIVLFIYFILVILLLCRYGRRRRTTSEQPGLDSSAEQGRCHLVSYHIRRVVSCCRGEDGCYSCCLPQSVPFCPRRCQQMEGSGKPTTTTGTTILNLNDSGKDLGKSMSSMLVGKSESDQAEQNRISEVPVPVQVPPPPVEDKKGTAEVDCGELKDQQSGTTGYQHPNEESDNEESMEED